MLSYRLEFLGVAPGIMGQQLRIIAALIPIALSSCATIDDLRPLGGGRTYDVAYSTAHRIALDTLEELQFSIKKDDSNKGEIRAQNDEYWNGIFHCKGNLIGVFLTAVGIDQTRVEIQSLYVQPGADLACKEKAQQVTSEISQRLRQNSGSPSSRTQPLSSQVVIPPAELELLQARFRHLAEQLSAGIKTHHVSRIAILPITDSVQKTNTPLGNYLTEKVGAELYKISSAKIIERSQLQRVLGELSLSMRGAFDDTSVKKIGKLLGVDAVILGTFAEIGTDTVEVNARVVTIDTAEVIGAGAVSIPRGSVSTLTTSEPLDFNSARADELESLPKNTAVRSSFDFRKTNWGMTKDQVKKAELGRLVSEDDGLLVFSDKVAGRDVQIGYVFIGDKLVRSKYVFLEQHSNENLFISDYVRIKEILTEKYGPPLEDRSVWANELYRNDQPRWGMAVSVGHLLFFSEWKTPSTHIFHGLKGDNFKISLQTEYSSRELGRLEKQSEKDKALSNF